MPLIIQQNNLYIVSAKKWMPKSVHSTKLDCFSSSDLPSSYSSSFDFLVLLKSLNLHQISFQLIEKSFLRVRLLVLLDALISSSSWLLLLILPVPLLVPLLLVLLLVVLLLLFLLLLLLLLLLLHSSSQLSTNLLQPSSNP